MKTQVLDFAFLSGLAGMLFFGLYMVMRHFREHSKQIVRYSYDSFYWGMIGLGVLAVLFFVGLSVYACVMETISLKQAAFVTFAGWYGYRATRACHHENAKTRLIITAMVAFFCAVIHAEHSVLLVLLMVYDLASCLITKSGLLILKNKP